MTRILITMPEDFLNKVNGLAEQESITRSELIRVALKSYMHRVSKSQQKHATANAKILEDILS